MPVCEMRYETCRGGSLVKRALANQRSPISAVID